MITRQECGEAVWIDLESPTFEELSEIADEYNLNSRIIEEILTPTSYPFSLSFGSHTFAVLHFPVPDSTDGARVREIDVVVGKNFIVTAHYEAIESLVALHRVFESEDLLGMSGTCTTTNEILERILMRLYATTHDDIEHVATRLDRIERDIFAGKERFAVRTISETGRALLRFETALSRQRKTLAAFLETLQEKTHLGASFQEHAVRIEGRRAHAAETASAYRAIAQELRATNDSLLSASQNEVTKTLTVVAFIALPLTLIASIFGMNTPIMPLVKSPDGFWIIIGLMIVVSLGLYAFFRVKRWL